MAGAAAQPGQGDRGQVRQSAEGRRMSAAMERVETLRVPPHNTDAEQYVLGAVLVGQPALWQVADWLTEDDFYRRDHRLIWRAMLTLANAGKPTDVVTLAEWLEA